MTDFSIAVLISGAGTSLQNLIDRISDGQLPGVRISVVISSREEVEGVNRARRAGLPIEVIRRRDYADEGAFSDVITKTLEGYGVQLAVMAGWLCFYRVPPAWMGRVINIHPSLLPEYGGRGFYGLRVHKAVLAARRTKSGATVHVVDNEYDHGLILMQRECNVFSDDTEETLSRRVGEIEREILPAVILELRSKWMQTVN